MSIPPNHTFLSLPSKRALNSTDCTTLLPSKRPKKQLPPPPLPAGHASIRLLCYASTVSAFIGKSGSTIKQLQTDTRSKIRVDDSLLPGSDRRVIVIVAPSVPSKSVKLRNNDDEEMGYAEEVSVVQEAALRVFEKLLEVSKEDKKTVTCEVLIDGSQGGFVIGKGGKMVEKLKRDSGAKIRVLLGNSLPSDVPHLDEVVEIEGDVLSVKKGLLGVCGRLQQSPQEVKSSKKESKPIESTSQQTVGDYYIGPPLQQTKLYAMSESPATVVRPLSYDIQRSPLYLTTTSSSSATLTRPSSFEADIPVSFAVKSHQEVVFKLLCPIDRVGGVIGKGGSVVRALQEETGAAITVGPAVTNCDERLVTVTSKEDVDSRYSPAQRAAVLVYSRSAEAAPAKGHEASSNKGHNSSSNKGSSISARLVVPTNQVGCLLGKGGNVISEMRKTTGANISILKVEQVPTCASEDERVVEITGLLANIQDALYQVTSRLRSNLFPSKVTSIPSGETSFSLVSDTTRPGRVEDQIPVDLHHSVETSQSNNGRVMTRHDLKSLQHPHARFGDQLPADLHQSFEASESIDRLPMTSYDLGSLRYPHDRLRDQMPTDRHQSYATLQSIGGLPMTRHVVDSLQHSHSRLRDQISTDMLYTTSHSIEGLPLKSHDLDALRHPHGIVRDQIPTDLHQSFASSQSIEGISMTRHGLDSLLHPHRSDHSPSARYSTSEVDTGVNHRSYVNLGKGLVPANGGIELYSPNRLAMVTNTTVEISVPGSAISSVYGENGRNLTRMRQISGAKVSLHEAPPGTRDWTILISGSPEETQAAQSLLHAFILTGSS